MRLYEVSMQSFREKALGKLDTAILPIGTIEAHGPHCPLGTDVMIPDRLALRLEEILGPDDVVIAPPVNYGHSWYLSPFPGTIDISTETLANYIFDIGRSLLKWGLKNIVFLNGHGANAAAMSIASERLADAGANVLTINWWIHYRDEILKFCSAQGHAGEDETSAVMAIRPDLVDLAAAGEPNLRVPFGDIKRKGIEQHTYPNAYSSDPSLASEEKGKGILEAVAQAMARHIAAFRAGKVFGQEG